MRPIKAFFATPFERHMTGDEHAVFEDADRVGEDVHVQNAAAAANAWGPDTTKLWSSAGARVPNTPAIRSPPATGSR